MTTLPLEYSKPRSGLYYGWVNLAVAALAMVATLPGRTQGIGLITNDLLKSFSIDETYFAMLNLWATLLGSCFSLAAGPLIDRWGSRVMFGAIIAGLAGSVLLMSFASSIAWLLAGLILTRGFGQSALSALSLTMVGKWFRRKLPLAMALFAVAISIGFIAAFPSVGGAAAMFSWRTTWMWMGVSFLVVILPLGLAFVRKTPESIGLVIDGDATAAAAEEEKSLATDFTLGQALKTPIFWSLAVSSAAFGLISSGLMLFNQSVLNEHGMDQNTVYAVLGIITMGGLLFNFLGGYLAQRWKLNKLMALAMLFLAVSVLALPLACGAGLVYAYAFLMGASAGIVTVIFFVCWGKLYGRSHLGAIQGAAQLLTVLASALGPVLLAVSKQTTGSSSSLFFILALAVGLLGLACYFSPIPKLKSAAT